MIPAQAIEAAKEAMREVTPPPGVSKADWLAEHGSFALIAGAIAAAAPYLIREAKAEAWDEAIAAAADRQDEIEQAIYAGQTIPDEPLPNPHRSQA